jgi:hypothetical protein
VPTDLSEPLEGVVFERDVARRVDHAHAAAAELGSSVGARPHRRRRHAAAAAVTTTPPL